MKNFSKKDLAIVGMSGRFPKSKNINEFWENLVGGKLLTKFYSDKELIELGVDKYQLEDKNYVKVSSFLEGSESFDYSFFGYTQEEGRVMDPQTRVMHEQVWLALEDGNLTKSTNEKVALYLSARDNPEWRSYVLMKKNEKVNPFFGSKLSNKNYMSTLISYSLNLKGPSYYVDAGSSSAMVAIHLACRSLLMQECTIAIAGGASISSKNSYGYHYREGMIYSKDGYCRAFDSGSSGTVPGEGAGVIVLKRLAKAIEDNDSIYAVIKSSAINNDGNRKVGYTAPSVQGQYECIKMAHQIAGIKSEQVSYVEAHGTGTEIGDPIEMKALNKAFNNNQAHTCALGSVKTNIGHLDKAAGVVGIIKTALALKNKLIPASLNFEEPNPKIDFTAGPFFVNTALKKWENTQGQLRYAGVSSFGLGGTNGHAILSEFVQEEKKVSTSRPYQLITCSARTKSALERYEEKFKNHLVEAPSNSLPNMAYTQNIGRKDFEYRKFVVSKTTSEILEQFNQKNNDLLQPIVENVIPNIVFMFPGQGSQYFKMAHEIYLQEDYFKKIMDQGFKSLTQETGKDYKAILGYSEEKLSEETLINDTQYTQPLLFLVEYSLCKLIMKWGITPAKMIGHSLGEYVAACISGVFSFEDALKIILKRADLMGTIEKGSMVAIGSPVSEITELLDETLSIAAINTDGSCVVSGRTGDVDHLITSLMQNETPYSKLKTSHAFHSEMMDTILLQFEEKLSQITFSDPKIPFISNLTGKEVTAAEVTSKQYWLAHIRETVKFSKGLTTLLKNENSIFIEVGASRTLATFLNQHKDNTTQNSSLTLLKQAKEQTNDNEKLVGVVGELWSLGTKINWSAYYEEESRSKIPLPTYAFETSNFPVRAESIDKFPSLLNNKRRKLSEWFYEPSWKIQNLHVLASKKEVQHSFLVFTNENQIENAFIAQLKKQFDRVITVKQGKVFKPIGEHTFEINSTRTEDYKTLFSALSVTNTKLDKIVYFSQNQHSLKEYSVVNEQTVFHAVLNIAKSLNEYKIAEAVKFTLVTNSLYEITGAENVNKLGALASGLMPVVNQENPLIKTQCIDVLETRDHANNVMLLYKEIVAENQEKIVALHQQKRWIKTYNKIMVNTETSKHSKIKEKGVYLITGGLGNLGFVYAKYLIEKYDASLIIVGRTSFENDEHEEASTKRKRLHELKSLGNIYYQDADVSNFKAMKSAISEGESLYSKINGIIHAAGIIDGMSFNQIDALQQQDCEIQFNAKVAGMFVLEKLFKNHTLDFCLLTSSLNSMIGGKALAAYAAANVYMDIFAQTSSLQHCMSVNHDKLNFFGRGNNFSMNKEEIIEVLEEILHLEHSKQIVVSIEDLEEKIARWMFPVLEENIKTSKIKIERSSITSSFSPPETITEIKLTDIFQEFFGLSNIGIHDDFFELGVDSLKGVMLKNQIHKEFGVIIPLVSLFEYNTVQKLSGMLGRSQILTPTETTENSIII